MFAWIITLLMFHFDPPVSYRCLPSYTVRAAPWAGS
jgi:hypothetical protein